MLETPIQTKYVRRGLYAYKYPNGIIWIGGYRYLFYSMTEAIKQHRRNKR